MLCGSCFCENLWLNAPVRFITVAFSLPPHPCPLLKERGNVVFLLLGEKGRMRGLSVRIG